MTEKTVLLSRDEIESVITMKDVVEIVEKTFEGFGDGTTINPTKVNLDLGEIADYPPYEGFMNAMPAYVGWADAAGIKWAGGFLGERKRLGLPYITSMIMLIDPHLGEFTAVMDGALITNWRTGAQTAVALKHLFKGSDSIKIGLYGAGMQGETQTLAIAEAFDIDEVRVYDIHKEGALRYAQNMRDVVKGEIIIVDTPEKAAVGDAIICVTPSKDKFVRDGWVQKGSVVFPMGSYQELENDLILNADKIIVDHVDQALHRGALAELNHKGQVLEGDIFATIGDLVAGNKDAGNIADQRMICVPIGTGAMDIAVASVALERAKQRGLGGSFSFVN